MDARTTPQRVTLDSEAQTLTIDWADGHRSVFPLDGLRRACPCVACQGGHAAMGALPDPEVFVVPSLMTWRDVRVEPVGRYALRLVWDDGHDKGIYSWERLRAMCPAERRPERPAGRP